MRTPPPELPGHAIEPSVRPAVPPLVPSPLVPPPLLPGPLLPPFPRQPARRRRRPLPDAVAVRRVPLPESAPPYDDHQAHAGHLRLARRPPGEARAPGEADQPGAPGRPTAAARRLAQPWTGPPVPAAHAGEWRSQFAQALAETLAGSRAPGQLAPWTTEQARKRIRQLGPMLQAGQRPRVRRVITSAPDSGVIEMTVIIGVGERVRALAVRLERTSPRRGQPERAQQWRCTAIEAA